ncbi:MAG: Peroxyureidoacrylate/ureidoacrylate amidohydrolase RutB [Syntrophorhabdaceae bacterium PtaU1.Bin034]|nr:MAG: Peroxyureidoacrylate/ureidoacrylate amidohydrolase RutB [Syntrophorhabdaceae bacterium PtaU1.Bin034]
MNEKRAILVVDVQGDFTEWKNGALPVPGTGEPFVREVERAVRKSGEAGLLIFGTQDWHPMNHVSFAINHPGKKPFDIITVEGRTRALWPPHCVQGTENAGVLLDNNLFRAIIKKGQHPKFDSYSGFQDEGGLKTEIDAILRRNGIEELIIFGLATDYCVRATVLDALSAGYRVTVVKELCRGINPDTTEQAIKEMEQKGARIIERFQEI